MSFLKQLMRYPRNHLSCFPWTDQTPIRKFIKIYNLTVLRNNFPKLLILGRVNYMWCTEPFRLPWKPIAGNWKKFQKPCGSGSTIPQLEEIYTFIWTLRMFSHCCFSGHTGLRWTCCHPSNGSLGKCCECHKAFSSLMQIKTTNQKQFVWHLGHPPNWRAYENKNTILCWCSQHDVLVSKAIPDV